MEPATKAGLVMWIFFAVMTATTCGILMKDRRTERRTAPVPRCLPVDAGTPPTASDRDPRSVRFDAESDVFAFLMAQRLEPHGALNCYAHDGRFECPVRVFGGPTRWATCRPRTTTEREDDGSRCAWIGDAGR